MGRYLKIVLRVFLLAMASILSVSIFIGVYFLGVIKGYELAQKDASLQISNFLEEFIAKQKATGREKPSSTPTPTPVKFISKSSTPPRITWGGPELWEAVNKKRQENGVNPLSKRDELCTIASIRLNELLELGKLDNHEGFSNMRERRPDLAWIFDKYSVIAEFLAVGGVTPQETVSLWQNTLGHSKLLTGGEYVWGCIYAQNTFAVAIAAY